MPDLIVCPNCGRKYPQRPDMAGRKLRCECGASFRLPAAAVNSPPPAPDVAVESVQAPDPLRARLERARRKQPSRLLIGLVAGGAIAAVSAILVVAFWPRENGEEQAAGSPAQNQPADTPRGNAQPQSRDQPSAPNTAQQNTLPAGANSPDTNVDDTGGANGRGAANNAAPTPPQANPRPAAWAGSLVDPPATRWADIIPRDADWRQLAPDWTTKIALPEVAGEGVLFLETGRSWFNSSTLGGDVDVPSQKLLTSEEGFRPLGPVSPDGRFVVGQSQRVGETVRSLAVAQIAEPEIAARLPGPHSIPRFVEFLDNERLLVIDRGIQEPWLAKVFALPSGEEQLSFELPELDPLYDDFIPRFAISPGRKYLAFGTADGTLRLFTIATGELAGALTFGLPRGRWASARSVNFSPDGRQLSVWYKFDEHPGGPPNSRIVCWDLATGERTDALDFQASLSLHVHDRGELANGLVWLPDLSGWIACGKWLIDRQSGEIVWSLPLPENAEAVTLLQPLDDARMLWGWQQLADGRRQMMLETIELPREQIDAARAQAQAGSLPQIADRPTEKLVDVL